MNQDVTPYATRDHWIAAHNAARQDIAELRYFLVLALHSPLGPDALEKARVLLERTK